MSTNQKLDPMASIARTAASDVKRLGWRGVMKSVTANGKLLVTNHNEPQAVIVSIAEYRAMTQARQPMDSGSESALESLRRRFDERLALGLRRLDAAIALGRDHAFETTLGGRTMPSMLRAAAHSHDVLMWFVGLSWPDLHLARVWARVAVGGHDIAEAKIRERYPLALENLIALLPVLSQVRIYDNSVEAAVGTAAPESERVAHIESGRLLWPRNPLHWRETAEWAKPIIEAALVNAG